LKYVVVHDCGTVINPMIIAGQIFRGVAQGIGNAFYEQLVFDDAAQLLNASLAEYLLPGSLDVPTIDVAHTVTPSPLNPLGIKGAGEAGAIPVGPLFAQAIEDAPEPAKGRFRDPLGPVRWRLLRRKPRYCDRVVTPIASRRPRTVARTSQSLRAAAQHGDLDRPGRQSRPSAHRRGRCFHAPAARSRLIWCGVTGSPPGNRSSGAAGGPRRRRAPGRGGSKDHAVRHGLSFRCCSSSGGSGRFVASGHSFAAPDYRRRRGQCVAIPPGG
jgi:hypothetical protein